MSATAPASGSTRLTPGPAHGDPNRSGSSSTARPAASPRRSISPMRWCRSATKAASRSATTASLPRLLLAGRNAERLAAVARAHGIADWTTDLDAALADPAYRDLLRCRRHAAARRRARKGHRRRQAHLFREAGGADRRAGASRCCAQAEARGLRHGAVEDKVYLPGMQKLARLTQTRRARPHRRLPARIRLVGVRRHRPAGPAAELELSPRRRRRRPDPRYVSALALRDRDDRSAASSRSRRRTGPPSPERIDERGPALCGRRRGRRRDAGRAGERRLRHDPVLLGDAGAARRPVHPAGRRHQGLGARRAAPLPRADHGADARASRISA